MEFTIEQLSNDVLKSIFDAAFLESELDEDGDLVVNDICKVCVYGMPEQECLGFVCWTGIQEGKSRQKVLENCNKFNFSYLGLKAWINESNNLAFAYQIFITNGRKIEAKEIIRQLRCFQSTIHEAVNDDEVFDIF